MKGVEKLNKETDSVRNSSKGVNTKSIPATLKSPSLTRAQNTPNKAMRNKVRKYRLDAYSGIF